MAPYISGANGYWGERTSTLDWCEKNYEVTYFIAEFWNTITNIVMIILPLWGIRQVFTQNVHKSFILSHLTLLAVGLGSWAFHMTLLYPMQLMDELPMVWGACYLLYTLHTFHVMRSKYTGGKTRNAKLVLSFVAVAFTVLYLIWPIPLFHNSVYAVLIMSAFYYELSLMYDIKCGTCKKIFVASFATCVLAFGLWNIDKHMCGKLTIYREYLPNLARPITQLHGWWHLLVGYGFYLQTILAIHIYYDIQKHLASHYGLQQFSELLVKDYGLNIQRKKRIK